MTAVEWAELAAAEPYFEVGITSGPSCLKCHGGFYVDEGCEPTPLCRSCTYEALDALADGFHALRLELARTRAALVKTLGPITVRCRCPGCLASIDPPLVLKSAWQPDSAGRWYCPGHAEHLRPLHKEGPAS